MTIGGFMSRLIRLYQRCISPFLPPSCRYVPSCSEYARQAYVEWGLIRGTWLSLCRLLRCHPLHPGGYDPPPCREDSASSGRDEGSVKVSH